MRILQRRKSHFVSLECCRLAKQTHVLEKVSYAPHHCVIWVVSDFYGSHCRRQRAASLALNLKFCRFKSFNPDSSHSHISPPVNASVFGYPRTPTFGSIVLRILFFFRWIKGIHFGLLSRDFQFPVRRCLPLFSILSTTRAKFCI